MPVESFEFLSVPRILFGVGQAARIGQVAASLGKRALLIFNGAPSPNPRIVENLEAARVALETFRQQGEPTIADVERALDLARRGGCDLIIGVGGGSAIDCAKAVATLLANGGVPLDYMEVIGRGQEVTKPAAPWIAVPTTAGAGAEVTRNAVISDPARRFKASIRGAHLLARVALVDPELAVPVPPGVTASCGMDALCQCIESYTSTGAQPMTDALALSGARLASAALALAVADGANLGARRDMAMAALFSGICLTNAGLGAVHGFAAPLGANFPAPHGTICGALLAPVFSANVRALRRADPNHLALSRYAALGRAMSGRPIASDADAIDTAVARCAELAREVRIPRLGQFAMTEQDVAPMVALAKKSSSMRYNPIVLSDDELSDVLSSAI